MRTILLIFVTAIAVSGSAIAEEKKEQQCNTYCNSVNMDGSGGTIFQTVCTK